MKPFITNKHTIARYLSDNGDVSFDSACDVDDDKVIKEYEAHLAGFTDDSERKMVSPWGSVSQAYAHICRCADDENERVTNLGYLLLEAGPHWVEHATSENAAAWFVMPGNPFPAVHFHERDALQDAVEKTEDKVTIHEEL